MPTSHEAVLVRVHVGESDRQGHKPAYEAIVLAARDAGLAGATVLRGRMGFGATSTIHTEKILRLSTDLPVVIEMVDREAKVNEFLPSLKELVGGGMITLEKVQVIRFRRTDDQD